MENEKVTVILNLNDKCKKDIEIPLNITANELMIALNSAYKLGMDTDNISLCYLRSENPIALLKGSKSLYEYGIRNGTLIYYKKRRSIND